MSIRRLYERALAGLTAANLSIALSAVVVLASLWLSVDRLGMTGLTWDEHADYTIALDYLETGSYVSNQRDPSQGRLSHIAAAMFMGAVQSHAYWAFKAPFVVAGWLGGLILWLFLRKRVSAQVAAVQTAFYFSCPFVLAASRAAATAGDILVVLLNLLFIIGLFTWLKTGRFWPNGLLTGLVLGASIGAKWSSATLAILAGVYLLAISRTDRKQLARMGTQVLALAFVTTVVGLATTPTLLNGIDFVKRALNHSLQFGESMMLQFGVIRASPPWYYIPAVAISKFSPFTLGLLAFAIGDTLTLFWRRRTLDPLRMACLISVAPVAELALKSFQNAHYYVGAVPAVMVLGALALSQWESAKTPWLRRMAIPTAATALLLQLGVSLYLAPDFLLAGRQFGRLFEGQFQGPAIHHCQGGPFAIEAMNQLVLRGAPTAAYHLDSCLTVLALDARQSPVTPSVPIRKYPSTRPNEAHLVIISGIYDFDSKTKDEAVAFKNRKDLATSSCSLRRQHPDYSIYECPPISTLGSSALVKEPMP